MTLRFTPDAELLEKDFDKILVGTEGKPGLARQVGFLAYHTLRSKGSQPGYPDWTLVRDRVVFIESKTEKGVVSDSQRRWIRALLKANAEVYVARPRYLESLGWVLARQYRPKRGEHEALEPLYAELDLLGD